ncbi:MAG TPA: hypothetical protein DER60_11755 [Syntrophomonas sp.]|nr:hypothetical protein [Syntrophomonas sp.]
MVYVDYWSSKARCTMKRKWISSLLVGIIFLGSVVGPVAAALCPGDFLPWMSAATAEPETGLSTGRDHVVRNGDTLWALSREYHVDLDALLLMNNLDENDLLTVGRTLKIPISTCTVKKGDTLSSLASRYQVSVEALAMANQGKDPYQLEVGDVLIIPGFEADSIAASSTPSRGYSIDLAAFGWPVSGAVTSAYGWRKSGFHHGVDIAQETGAPIKAAADGIVIFSGAKPIYGKTVIISHNDGRETLYAHAQSILVHKNQRVRKGQIIALVGTTGRTTGPHVHFEVKLNGKTVNPLSQLR